MCIRGFKTLSSLHSHFKAFHVDNCYRNCASCIRGFISPEALRVHLSSQHKDYSKFSAIPPFCLCTSSSNVRDLNPAKTLSSLQSHFTAFHVDNCYRHCASCIKGFTSPEALRAHLSLHQKDHSKLSGKPPFCSCTIKAASKGNKCRSCSKCVQGFNFIDQLESHISLFH